MSNTKSPDSAGKQGVDAVLSSDVDADVASQDPGRRRFVAVAGIAALILVVDQLTKIWAVSALADDRNIDLFWTARFNLHRNFASAFGLGAGLGRWLTIPIVAVTIGLIVYARTITDRRMLLMVGTIVGGAVGNLIDRLMRAENGFMSGGVIDFIDFQWWPIFNVADMAVVCGAIGLMLLSLREPHD